MRLPFLALPLEDQPWLRPVARVVVDDAHAAPVLCLVDTGAIRTRLPGFVARELGLDLSRSASERVIIAGVATTARQAYVRLGFAHETCDCSVWFCDDDFAQPFGLLGQEDFLRQFRLTLCAADGWFSLEREPAATSPQR